jgi:hypothetical protein
MAIQKFIIQVCGWLVGLPLEFLVISALARGPYRRFPLVFAYAAALFVTTLVEIPPFVEAFVTRSSAIWRHAAKVYWVDELILQVLVFALVISLVNQAISTSRWRRVARAGMMAGALLYAGTSMLVHYQRPPATFGSWMTPWTRDIGVCATILDLALWMMLIASRKADGRLLLISGALGIQFTGEAIGEAVRNLSIPNMVAAVSLTGSVVAVAADMTCLYIWWKTFSE